MSKKTVENKTGIPVSTLIDDLKSEDIRKRQLSVQNLNVIASALGPERTRLELIPFLNELMDDEDEILSALAESLSNFIDFVGGNQNAVVLFSVLESLCKVDESSVRNKAAQTLISLIKVIDIKKNEELLQNLVKRLNESENYLAKGPLTMIIPSFYGQVSSSFQQELNKIYLAATRDQIPQVKKQASLNLKDFVAVACPKSDDVVLSIINQNIEEEQDFVRLYMVDACTRYLKTEGTQKNHSIIHQHLKNLSEDKSWRIKYYLCEKLQEVTQSLGKSDFKRLIFGNYIKYLEDQEPELRSIAATKLSVVGAQIEPDEVVQKLIPIVKTLSTDTQNYVRNSLAQGFLGLSQFIGKKNSVDLILPVLLQLLKDEDSEVRISLFKSLNQITNVLGIDTLQQSIVPALSDLAQDKNWRIRSSSIDIISFFAKEIGSDFLNDKIIKILMDWLSDRVYAVRESAVQSVKNIIQSLGWQWSEKNIMPKILALKDQTNYLHRETLLFILIQSNKQINSDYLNKNIVPTLISLSKDPVANIRFNVAKCFKALSTQIKEKEQTKKVLTSLCEDSDIDVKYFAKQALDSM
ncbi:serine/threonine-protein phosphatase 2A 65 kDa regulatory subunit A beta (macronuclear) [Tetrahymena thermophila SB210]|uniref:Serine/threonine-protein phosphatase 2A 65 kDa regulatory subunit A beta n=1 Tax=Tetrahymena thermophila (strain SB210) TaxID=312017 RepID=Q22Y55_TETTS|nr:serine/threonine-protein phosphatase 2A 65 kDa regulatory subunit A beta [Tetrahymena thermophila SB210]EAR90169.2 serine/threonine-protein phosphatase 2A 65 kDa regulatory subunit A beta [Tetrahymena thermophila SB210]|eukprot:XP_001010414.2 serine/threonine-protein phosphatase 2A 65 kDa regulatory subunit A beta [Tetrahymena thermophila SB210]